MKEVRIIAAPYHAGAYNVRVGQGPLRLLEDRLEQALATAGLGSTVELIPSVDEFDGEIGRSFELKRRIAAAVEKARVEGDFPLVIAGNCNSSVGTWSGLGDPEAGVIWFDAHPDFDTPNEHRSGYFDGMGVASLAGQCWRNLVATIPGFQPLDPRHLVYCGIRDFEPGQLEKVQSAGIRAAIGSKETAADYEALLTRQLSGLQFTTALYHLDVDCLDIGVGKANEYACEGGLSVDQLFGCLRLACAAARPLGLTIASFNPAFEGADRISRAAISAAVQVASCAR